MPNVRSIDKMRLLGIRAEAAFWITRPQSIFSQVPIALAAWSIGAGGLASSSIGQVLGLIGLLAVFQAAMFVVNDIYDAKGDELSAPYMPLPSGLLSKRMACGESLVLGVLFLMSILGLGKDPVGVVAVLVTLPPALGTMKLYGLTKSFWFSPLLGATTFASAALWAWLLAGRQNVGCFVILFTAAALHGIHANLRAQLRDIAGDPKAGHITLAAKMGPKWTMFVAAGVRLVELLFIALLWIEYGNRFGWLWLAAAIALFCVACSRMPYIYSRLRSRIDQTEALSIWVYSSLAAEVAVLGVLQPVVAAPTVVGMLCWFKIVRRGYYGRLASGYLANRLNSMARQDFK